MIEASSRHHQASRRVGDASSVETICRNEMFWNGEQSAKLLRIRDSRAGGAQSRNVHPPSANVGRVHPTCETENRPEQAGERSLLPGPRRFVGIWGRPGSVARSPAEPHNPRHPIPERRGRNRRWARLPVSLRDARTQWAARY